MLFVSIALLVFSLDFYSSFGIGLFVFFSVKLFLEIGEKIEIRDIIIILASLQWIIGPLLAYLIYPDDKFYYMAVPLKRYMSYVIPATFTFAFGMYIPLSNKKISHDFYLVKINSFLQKNRNIDIIFIVIGVTIRIFINSFPQSLRFAFVLLAYLRFVGVFFLLVSNRKHKWLFILIIFLFLLLEALKSSLFHDFLLWVSFFIIIASFIKKPTIKKKFIYLVGILVFAVSVQTIKYSYRNALKKGNGEGINLFSDLIQKEVLNKTYVTSESNLSSIVTRINQGWIIARIMYWTPSREPFAHGETIEAAVNASLLPRFLVPNKITAGGRTYFERFTGKKLSEKTSMGLSLLGEAYANYGIFGGVFFMLIIGLFYNFFILKIFHFSKKHPSLIFFIPLIFLQVVKAETDFSVILNYLVKASIVVWFIFWSLNKFFKVRI